jgi:hypothetical protein
MLSCSPGDCGGWYWYNTLNWIKSNGAIHEECFPYTANDSVPCDAKCENWHENLVGVRDFRKVTSNVTSIQNALVTYGPLGATMDVYDDFYPDYTGGIYTQQSEVFVFGHCITIVGYNNTGNHEGYWICKNSWGTEWGENGWFRIAYGECNIEKNVYYCTGPNTAPTTPPPPVGPNRGKSGETYTYSVALTDGDGDNVRCCFDWGDGNVTWTDFVASGETVTADYTWHAKGTYSVRVQVQDQYHLESLWSDPLPVSIPKTAIFSLDDVFNRVLQLLVKTLLVIL